MNNTYAPNLLDDSQREAIEVADAYTNNAALPTYSLLLDALAVAADRLKELTEGTNAGRDAEHLCRSFLKEAGRG